MQRRHRRERRERSARSLDSGTLKKISPRKHDGRDKSLVPGFWEFCSVRNYAPLELNLYSS